VTKSQDQLHNVNVVSSDLLATPEESSAACRSPTRQQARVEVRETVRAIIGAARIRGCSWSWVRAPFTTWLPRANMQPPEGAGNPVESTPGSHHARDFEKPRTTVAGRA